MGSPIVCSITITKNVYQTLNHPGWRQTMIVEMKEVDQNQRWELMPRLARNKIIWCNWVYVIVVRPNGQIDCLKAIIVFEGCTQIYGLDLWSSDTAWRLCFRTLDTSLTQTCSRCVNDAVSDTPMWARYDPVSGHVSQKSSILIKTNRKMRNK